MNIVADENIPLVNEFFGALGNVQTLPGRQINARDVADADILLVRSVTQVDQALLHNSAVRFVGSCTAGMDHVDTDFLDRNNITWASAPGCNAEAVVQYALTAMARLKPKWMTMTIGIIGCGNVGGRLYHRLRQLGVTCYCYDPFLTDSDCSDLVSLEHLLACADIISCHAPLTTTGDFPTYHLLSAREFKQLKPHVLLINCGRGAVINNSDLLTFLQTHNDVSVALDVWENEPDINLALLRLVDIATPHIAGYSVEGKRNGTAMVAAALGDFLNIDEREIDRFNAIIPCEYQPLNAPAFTGEQTDSDRLNTLLLTVYDLGVDDSAMRAIVESKNTRYFFDQLRKSYPARRDYSYYQCKNRLQKKPLSEWLAALAFNI